MKTLLTNEDPPPFSMRKGTSPFIFTFPHNSKIIPKQMEDCLGTDPQWFDQAHESHDLNMTALQNRMEEAFPNASFINGNYSRLVVDLNSKTDYSVKTESPEDENIKIPSNQPDRCCHKEKAIREKEIYWPYHEAKKRLIENRLEQHNAVIVIDMHSFTPIWDGEKRTVEIGTIRAEKTPLSRTLERLLKTQNEYSFISGEPYRAANKDSNAAEKISEYHNIQYLGLEIRNDLIATQKDIHKMTSFIKKCIDHLTDLPQNEYKQITARRSDVIDIIYNLNPNKQYDDKDENEETLVMI